MVAATLALRFACELLMLAALAIVGADALDGVPSVVLAVALPALAAVAWGRFVAPNSSHRLTDPARAGVEVVVFGSAAAGLAAVGHGTWAVALGVVALLTAVGSRVIEGSAQTLGR